MSGQGFEVVEKSPWLVKATGTVPEGLKRCSIGKGHSWYVPRELVSTPKYQSLDRPGYAEALHPYQWEAVQKAVQEKRWVFNDEMGLGKSIQAIIAARITGAAQILIICPAVVRTSWAREIARWWPDRSTDVGIIRYGADKKGLSKKEQARHEASLQAPIRIVSYNLIQSCGNVGTSPGMCIIIDEAHRLKNPKSIQSKSVRAICGMVPADAAIFGLTATMMPDNPEDF